MMRDLSTQELGFVYGAGTGCAPTPPSKGPKSHKGSKGKGSRKHSKGKGTGSRGKNSGSKGRCGC